MKFIIEAEPKEIADLVLQLQSQQKPLNFTGDYKAEPLNLTRMNNNAINAIHVGIKKFGIPKKVIFLDD